MKFLYVIGSTLAIGLTWFFAIYALLTQALSIEPTTRMTTLLLIVCAVAGAAVGWKLFAAPSSSSRQR